MMGWLKRRRRAHIVEEAFPPAWRAVLGRNVPIVSKLDAAERKKIEDMVRIFVAEKHFEGCAGLDLTDEMRVTVAGQACMLLLHLDEEDVFPTVESVLVYPSVYRAPSVARPGGIVIDEVTRAGESWRQGTLVLAWDEVLPVVPRTKPRPRSRCRLMRKALGGAPLPQDEVEADRHRGRLAGRREARPRTSRARRA